MGPMLSLFIQVMRACKIKSTQFNTDRSMKMLVTNDNNINIHDEFIRNKIRLDYLTEFIPYVSTHTIYNNKNI
ncbi:rCG25021 [Rattus norvegicus]|uniref:RCG25021 n=1 Tax=Rattus norvegicus TaxID=10116 RepID=A6KFF4_RAT|nr:rCG25021 [Rattus norvegicus]